MTQEQTINDIAIKVGRLEVMQDASTKAMGDLASSVNKLVDKLDRSDDVAKDADQRSRSAHKRVDDLSAEIRSEIKELKDDRKWLWRTATAALVTGVIGGAVAIIWQVISK
ncbi:hypothetical protein ACX1C1_03885 [Paenibacillus sp. strain BS8-2]